jgi:selenide,water dikinase
MPIVDDAFTFGKIAATNSISDVYAMGGHPILAIGILGWPVDKLPPELAGEVVRGAQATCEEAGIPLAGGHSIDSPEPIFGLAVTGRVAIPHLKRNKGAQPGDLLFLTKPLGTGILSTAQKKDMLKPEHQDLAPRIMMQLNRIGEELGKVTHVHAMTDVTGFGLAGHLLEMCKASGIGAVIEFDRLPLIHGSVLDYIAAGCIPGGTQRNYQSYGHDIRISNPGQKEIVCDPQTSGGLLIAVDSKAHDQMQELLRHSGLHAEPIGMMVKKLDRLVQIQ